MSCINIAYFALIIVIILQVEVPLPASSFTDVDDAQPSNSSETDWVYNNDDRFTQIKYYQTIFYCLETTTAYAPIQRGFPSILLIGFVFHDV